MLAAPAGTKGSARYSYNDWMENTPHIVHSHTYAPYPYTVRELDRFFVVRADPNAHLTRMTATHFWL